MFWNRGEMLSMLKGMDAPVWDTIQLGGVGCKIFSIETHGDSILNNCDIDANMSFFAGLSWDSSYFTPDYDL